MSQSRSSRHVVRPVSKRERGFLLIEALVAILIFSLGILGMIAMGSAAISTQSEASYRTDAERLAQDISNTIAVSVDRSSPDALAASLAPFAHNPTGAACVFDVNPSSNAEVTAWLGRVKTVGPSLPGLPGVVDSGVQIIVTNTIAAFNRVDVTVCWKAPGTSVVRHHTVVSYIN